LNTGTPRFGGAKVCGDRRCRLPKLVLDAGHGFVVGEAGWQDDRYGQRKQSHPLLVCGVSVLAPSL